MTYYNVFLLAGGFLVLLAASDGIWYVLAPGARKSPVPRRHSSRLAALGVGLVMVVIGMVGLFTQLA